MDPLEALCVSKLCKIVWMCITVVELVVVVVVVVLVVVVVEAIGITYRQTSRGI